MKSLRYQIPLLLAVGLGVLAGCSSASGPAISREINLDFSPEQKAALEAVDGSAYVIRRGDVLSVRDMFVNQINQEAVLVLPDGNASFFGLDQVKVEGLTLTQLDRLLTEQYAQEFRSPQVTVAVRELAQDYIYVLGEVEQPGMYKLQKGGFGVVNAIASAGGFAFHAQKGAVVLIRVTADGFMCREMDLASMNHPKYFDPALLDVQPFDVIYVTRTAIGDFAAFTDGLVGSLLKYTRLAADIRYIQSTNLFVR